MDKAAGTSYLTCYFIALLSHYLRVSWHWQFRGGWGFPCFFPEQACWDCLNPCFMPCHYPDSAYFERKPPFKKI